ncbi:MAG: SDR family NAD(P)-dependent oxidoreductase [Candidatus Saccharibacteria bacterium]
MDSTTQDRVILITGATDGFGKYVATKLASQGGVLLLHGRNSAKLTNIAKQLTRTFPQTKIETYLADFADLGQVARMAKAIAANHSKLDVLINNAGIGFGAPDAKREVGRDGYELRLTVNYLAPYLITRRLMPLLKAAPEARIVNIASVGQSPIDFSNLMLDRNYGGVRAYCQSKLALIMATFDWAEELRSANVTANAIHPATYAATQMTQEAGIAPLATISDGGDPIIWLATSPELRRKTGSFYNQRSATKANAQAYDPEARAALRAHTKQLLSAY